MFSWAGHAHSVFSQDGAVLYYADYWPDRTGCEIVARDLKAGKELWRTNLHGLGPIKHSGYSNQVAMEADHQLITVRGKESMGRYIEFLDPRTGRILGHRIYEGPYRLKPNGEWINLPPEKWNDPSPSLQLQPESALRGDTRRARKQQQNALEAAGRRVDSEVLGATRPDRRGNRRRQSP